MTSRGTFSTELGLRLAPALGLLAVALGLITMQACGGSSKNPVPTITSLSPSSAMAGAAPTTLTVNGSGFITTSSVTFNSVAHTATVVSASQLTIPLSAADLATAGSFVVTVTNAAPGGGSASTTGATNFSVSNPAPTITSISPTSVPVGAAAQTLTVNGAGFVATSVVNVNSAPLVTSFVSSTQLTAAITAASFTTVGNLAVNVTNAAPGGGSSSSLTLAVTAPLVSGTAYKGPVMAATVNVFAVKTDASNGSKLGTGVTDASGNFSVNLSSAPTSPIRITVSGGTYSSEQDGSTITGTSSVSALIDNAAVGAMGVSVTPASEFVNALTVGKVKGTAPASHPTGKRVSASTPSVTAAHAAANAELVAFYGMTAGLSLEALAPKFTKADITANPDNFKLGLVIGALAEEGKLISPTSPDDLIAALSADLADGLFDGKASGTAVKLGTGNLPSTAGTSDFLNDLASYVNTGTAVTGAGILPSDVSGETGTISTGVSTSPLTPPSVGLTAGSSGAIGSASFNGFQYLFVAGRQKGVIVVDITDPSNPTPTVKSWPSLASMNFSGNSIGGVVPLPSTSSGHPQVLAYAYNSKHFALLNAETLATGTPGTDNPVDLEGDLPIVATSPISFSGGSAYIAGAIPAPGVGIYLATADGYYLFNTTTDTLGTLFPVDISQLLTENLGGDVGNGQLLAGNYFGVQLVDLNKGASYYMDSGTLFSNFFLPEVDGNSVDGSLRVGILTPEDRSIVAFVNLASLTETTSTTTGVLNSFSVGAGGAVPLTLQTTSSIQISGSAVDGTTHLALFMAGFSNDIAVGQLQDPTTVPWVGLSDWRYYTLSNSPALAFYQYATDPHAVGVVFNQGAGKAYGYLLDGADFPVGVVQIDMAGFVALTAAGSSGDAAHQPAGDPVTAGALSEIAVP